MNLLQVMLIPQRMAEDKGLMLQQNQYHSTSCFIHFSSKVQIDPVLHVGNTLSAAHSCITHCGVLEFMVLLYY